MRSSIRGVGVVSPFGNTLDSLAVEGHSTTSKGQQAAVDGLEAFYSKRELRRTSHYCRLALLGANLALQDCGLFRDDLKSERVATVVATGYGPAQTTFDFLDSMYDFGASLASPTAFSTSVHNIAASMLSIRLGLTGPCLSVNQFSSSFASAMLTAQCWLCEGRADYVLVGAVDEYNAVLEHGIMSAGALSNTSLGLPVSEGAFFFVLDREDVGKRGAIDSVSFSRAYSGGTKVIHPAGQVFELACGVAQKRNATFTAQDVSGVFSAISLSGF